MSNDLAALHRQGVTLGFAGLDAADALGADTATSGDPSTLAYLVSLLRRIAETRAALLAAECGPELRGQAADCCRPSSTWSRTATSAWGRTARCRTRRAPSSPRPGRAASGTARRSSAPSRRCAASTAFLQAPFTLRRDRYCLPVPVHDRQAVPGLVLDVSATAATVFVEPFAVVELNNALAEAIAMARAAEEQALAEVAAVFARHGDELQRAAEVLAELDAFQARVLFGQAAGAALLVPGAGRTVQLWDARHPLLDPGLATLRERVLGEPGSTRPIVPLNLTFPARCRGWSSCRVPTPAARPWPSRPSACAP